MKNREIKFRYFDGSDMIQLTQMNSILYNFNNDESPIMQFTGLKDKNGIEIYEGDVYHQGDKNITYTVIYRADQFIGKQNGSSSFAGIYHWLDRVEVIGNIHENQELLK